MSNVSLSGLSPAPQITQQDPKLVSAAHEFEASLMKEFLKPLQQDGLFSEDGSGANDDAGGSAGTLMSYGAEAMAKAISEHGGFGIARKILDHFKETANHTQHGTKDSTAHC